MAISASEARSRLFPLVQQVNEDHEPVRITSKGVNAVLMSCPGTGPDASTTNIGWCTGQTTVK